MGRIVVTGNAGDARPSAARRTATALIAVLMLMTLGLAGCSAGGGASEGAMDGGGDGAEPGTVVEDEAASDADRSVIVEGSMSIVVTDVTAATDEATGIVRSAGGRIDGREEWRDGDGDETYAYTTMILRIPASSLDSAIDDLRELGTVESLQTSTRDVTTAVQDVDAHISGLESTIARLQAFQEEATSVADLLAIEKEIAARQTELESYLTRQADFAEQIEFSTLTLTLQSSPSQPVAAPDSFWSGLVVGWSSFSGFVAGFVVVLGMLLPWLVALGIVAGAIILIVRWRRGGHGTKQPDEPQAP